MTRSAKTILAVLALAGAVTARGAVGHRVLHVTVNGTTIAVAVWYPADGDEHAVTYGSARVPGRAAVDAPVKSGPWPLVVFAHGYSGSGSGSAFLGERAAAAGYVWAAPDYTDAVTEVRLEGRPTGDLRGALKDLREKPPSLKNHGHRVDQTRAVLDMLLGAPDFPIDRDRVALAGHSLGGWTAVHTARADARVRALVLYSMGELNYLFKRQHIVNGAELARLRAPVYLTYGSREKAALKGREPNTLYTYRHWGGPACVVEIRGGDHFVYVDPAAAGRHGGTDRQRARIADATATFLDRVLRGRSALPPTDQCTDGLSRPPR
jgi:dienelactone hydrolase